VSIKTEVSGTILPASNRSVQGWDDNNLRSSFVLQKNGGNNLLVLTRAGGLLVSVYLKM
jgi:hypothetical protein